MSLLARYTLLGLAVLLSACAGPAIDPDRVKALENTVLTLLGSEEKRRSELAELRDCALDGSRTEQWHWWHCRQLSSAWTMASILKVAAARAEDPDVAGDLRREAARLGDPEAREALREDLVARRARLGASDPERAVLLAEIIFWERFGAHAQNPEDQIRMACRHWSGVMGSRNLGPAIFWLLAAAEHGHPASASIAATLEVLEPRKILVDFPRDAMALQSADIDLIRSAFGEDAPPDDSGAAAWNPVWLDCLSQDPDALTRWWEQTGAPARDGVGEIALKAYRDGANALIDATPPIWDPVAMPN